MGDGARAPFVPGTPVQQRLFLLLLAIAAVLRFAPFVDLAYAHDELSALIRLHPTLADTFGKGVMGVDTHPPGVQVFLWGWTELVGLGEVWVKLPFMLSSLGALVLLHRIAAHLTDAAVALVFTAVLATIQYTVLYGQLARPYAFGLFTTAWMAERLLAYRDRGDLAPLFGVALAAALSAYVHHLAALQALLIGVSGLFLLPAARRRPYLMACAAAVAVYLPNLPVLRAQLAWKGLDEWLAPPTLGWFLDHARFITHWNGILGGLLAGAVLWAAARTLRTRDLTRTLVVIGLVWGALPYAITFGYSVWRAPVLQHSVVLFAFPYLLLLLLGGLKGMPVRFSRVLAIALAVVGTVTLITTRRHFAFNSSAHNRYEVIARGIIEANRQGHPALTDAPEHILRFHFDRWRVPEKERAHIDLTGRDAEAAGALLDSLRSDRVFLGTTLQAPVERPLQVRQRFPFLLARHDMVEGQAFLFSARPSPAMLNDEVLSSTLAPQAVQGRGWQVDPAIPLVADTAGPGNDRLRRWDLTGREFGILFAARLDSLGAPGCPVIEMQAEVQGVDTSGGARLVVEVVEGKQIRAYRTSAPLHHAQGTLAAAAATTGSKDPEATRVQAYLWNERRGPLQVGAVRVVVRQANPVQYAWLGPIDGHWTFRPESGTAAHSGRSERVP